MTKVLVTGSRYGFKCEYPNLFGIMNEIDNEWDFELLIEGGANGVDRQCRNWANASYCPVATYPAEWDNLEQPGAVLKKTKYGKNYNAHAGFYRNTQMLKLGKPDLAIIFPGGKGTADMARKIIKSKMMYITVDDEGTWQYGSNILF